jgi:RNA polymerase sigma-70 factor (ECF subfamily)
MSSGDNREDRLGGLMCAAQGGDRDAYRMLLREIAPMVRRIVHGRFPFLAREEAEDLVQDILLTIHSVRATYDSARPFMPWLVAIARHRSADMARRYARKRGREVAVDVLPETSAEDGTNPEEVYGDAEALRRAVSALPEGQRIAIELLKLKEMSLKEAASVSGMSIGALKVATHRATRALRSALGPKGAGE